MDIMKAQWAADQNNIQLSVPVTKVDTEKRLVSGFASLDNLDQHGDVVTAEASARAFSRARGNLREMHAPIAVGKVVNFKEDTFYDTKTEKFYQGVYVTAYVSKGAQDTWEKVIDGTLTGFSIGGNILDSDTVMTKDSSTPVRFIKDYELLELSLVDNPANQLANVFSIQKSVDGDSASGIASEVVTENIYYCDTDEIAKTSSDESLDCGVCGAGMTNIGWFEQGSDVAKSVAEAVAKYTTPESDEGGVTMPEEEITKSVETDEVTEPAVEAAEEGAEAGEETAVVEVEEVEEPETAEVVDEVEGDDLNKVIDNLRDAIEKKLESNAEEVNKSLGELDARFEKKFEEFDEKIETLKSKHAELTEKFAGLSEGVDGLSKSVDAVKDSTAIKKSGDLGGSSEDAGTRERESMWKGAFFDVDSL